MRRVDIISPYARMLVRVFEILLNPRFSFFVQSRSRVRLYKEEPTRDIGKTKAPIHLWQKHQQLFALKKSRNFLHAPFVAVSNVAVVVVTWAISIFAVFVSASSPTKARFRVLRSLLGNSLLLCTIQSQTCSSALRTQEMPENQRQLFLFLR